MQTENGLETAICAFIVFTTGSGASICTRRIRSEEMIKKVVRMTDVFTECVGQWRLVPLACIIYDGCERQGKSDSSWRKLSWRRPGEEQTNKVAKPLNTPYEYSYVFVSTYICAHGRQQHHAYKGCRRS